MEISQFLELSNYPILANKGKISNLEAKIKAESEFDKFRVIQDQNFQNDFDKTISKIEISENEAAKIKGK